MLIDVKKIKKTSVNLSIFLTSIFLLNSCKSIDTINKNLISIMIEDGPGFISFEPIKTQERGTDFKFKIQLKENYYISSINYDSYKIETDNEYTIIILEKVMYPTTITINTTQDYVIYHANGGKFNDGKNFYRVGKNKNHLLFNTLSGHDILKKENHLLAGWLDNSNNLIGIGSRCDRGVKHLRAKWVKESETSNFTFEKYEKGYSIKSYIGDSDEIVLPSYYENLPITEISKGTFNNLNIKNLYLNPYINNIEEGSFNNCVIDNLYFFDNLRNVKNSSFINSIIKKVQINVTRAPRFSGTFFDTFSDKMDYLKSIKDKKKIVLFSGSSTRYGYDSPLLKSYFPEYEVINMGVYAYFNAKIQLDIIKEFLLPGDVIIDAPEFDATKWQMFDSKSFEKRIFNMFESNYDNLKYVDISKYDNFFDSFNEYQIERDNLPKQNYEVSAMHLDDDGNYHDEEIYNVNGDFILDRKGEVEEGLISQHRLPYVKGQINESEYESFNKVYEEFKNEGYNFFFNYAPRNIDSLTLTSTKENRKLFEEEINSKIKAPFLSCMDDFLYPANHFYLIDNHLTSDGARKRTILTANNLAKFIK